MVRQEHLKDCESRLPSRRFAGRQRNDDYDRFEYEARKAEQ